MDKLKRIGGTMALLLLSVWASAQESMPKEADFMRSNGKVYVVMAVVITILVGLFIYLFALDRKIGKLEKESLTKS